MGRRPERSRGAAAMTGVGHHVVGRHEVEIGATLHGTHRRPAAPVTTQQRSAVRTRSITGNGFHCR